MSAGDYQQVGDDWSPLKTNSNISNARNGCLNNNLSNDDDGGQWIKYRHMSTVLPPINTPSADNMDGQKSIDLNDHTHLLLNIGGTPFRVRHSTLHYRWPEGLLAKFAGLSHEERVVHCDGYLEERKEYFFERTPRLFESVLDFYATGNVHRPPDLCPDRLLLELDYWRIPRGFFSPCCVASSSADTASLGPTIGRRGSSIGAGTGVADLSMFNEGKADEFIHVCWGKRRKQLWDMVEDPSGSLWAKVFTVISIGMVITSVMGLILGSVPELQQDVVDDYVDGQVGQQQQNASPTVSYDVYYRTSASIPPVEREPIMALQYLELCCIVWFTFEYTFRFFLCPYKCKFVRQPLNVIDALTIVPFYLEVALQVLGVRQASIREFKALVLVMRIVRVMRVARVFKLARYSSGLKSFGTTVQTSLPELSMLGLFLVTAIIFFSTLMYFVEKDEEDTPFLSIPHACWWCIITMTTVGYGDITPQTLFGKIIASFASISGVLVLAFPITMIVENFSKTYDTTKQSKQFQNVRRRRRMANIY